MPHLLRCVKQAKWAKSSIEPWLGTGDIPADPLGDFATQCNKLSVYRIEDGEEQIKQVAAAYAAGRQRPDKLDYLLFDIAILELCGIRASSTPGRTKDAEVNMWHLDLVELSGMKLVDLVSEVLNSDYETGRYLPKQVDQLVTEAVVAGRIPEASVPTKFSVRASRD
ncbi:MAG: hypothetical protein ISS49_15885 [Anaerolineae bacterium]|nr:hypothetical protein [Anaerolineae bacterium]